MALKVRWTLEAEETFEDIISYLLENWTEQEIRKFVRKTQKVIKQIEKNPYQFKASASNQVRKSIITKHNSLFYYVNTLNGVIELYAFWDNRKDPSGNSY